MKHLFSHNQKSVITQKRFVFATGSGGHGGGHGAPGGGSGAEGGRKPEDVTLDNLRSTLESMEGTTLTVAVVTKVLQAFDRANGETKKKILANTQKLLKGDYSAADFEARIPSVSATADARAETTEPSAEAAHGAKTKGEAGGAVIEIQSAMSEKLAQALGSVEQAIAQSEHMPNRNEQLTEKMKTLQSELKTLAELEKKSQHKTREVLNDAIKKRRLSKDEAEEILDIDWDDHKAEGRIREIIQPLSTGSSDEQTIANNILKAKKDEAKELTNILEDYGKRLLELRDIMSSLGDYIYQEAYKERSIKEHSRLLGFDLKEGKILRMKATRYVFDKDGKRTGEEPIYRRATVKKIFYEEVELPDSNGKLRKVPSLVPSITLEMEDEWPDAQGKKYSETQTLNAVKLKDSMDRQEIVELIEDRQDTEDTITEIEQLKTILGIAEIGPGSKFEYREISPGEGTVKGEDKAVEIIGIKKENDAYLNESNEKRKQTLIELSEEVTVTGYPKLQKKKVLTLGEFARWYKRMNAFVPLEAAGLGAALLALQTARNTKYNRSDAQYPPIEVKPGEVLYYDGNPQSTFMIKKVDDGGITLDNGSHYSPGSFYQWVKDQEIEKKTAEAEAHKKTDHIETPQEQKEAFEEAFEQATEEIEKRKHPDADTVLDHDEHHAHPSVSYLRSLWNQTHFLSFGDLYEMGKTVIEFITHHLHRHQKERVGIVGNAALTPIYGQLGAEFKTLQQSAEHEAVNRYIEAYKHLGPSDLYERLSITENHDELKAILSCLADKGAIRWDDKLLWDAINRISIVHSGHPHFITSFDENLIRETLDHFWGGQSYQDFKQRNDGSYGGSKNKFMEIAKRLENDPQGMTGKMQELIANHLHGHYVDPTEYEAYLHFAIEAGKLSFSDKIYFIMMGMGAVGPERFGQYGGQTLLTTNRISELEGTLMNAFPALDYFVDKFPLYNEHGKMIVDHDGNPKTGQFSVNHARHIIQKYIEADAGHKITDVHDYKDFKPGDSFLNFVEREIMTNSKVQTRLEKASKDMSKWDVDDYHMHAPHLGENQAEQLTYRSGASQSASPVALRNAFAGFNHYTQIHLDEFLRKNKTGNKSEAKQSLIHMMGTMRSFLRVHAIVDDRYHHNRQHELTRLNPTELNKEPNVDGSRLTRAHIAEMNIFMSKFIEKCQELPPETLAKANLPGDYFQGLARSWKIVTTKTSGSNTKDQAIQEDEVKNFGLKFEDSMRILEDSIGLDGIATMLSGIQYVDGDKKLIKGIISKPQGKKEQDEVSEQKVTLERLELADVKGKVEEIMRLRVARASEGGRSKEQIRDEENSRLIEVIKNVQAGNFGSITKEDQGLLDREIRDLQRPEDRDVAA